MSNLDTFYINETHVIANRANMDLTGATNLRIHYTKPDRVTTGWWPATLEGTDTVVYTTLDAGGDWEIDQKGTWKFWPSGVLNGATWTGSKWFKTFLTH